MQKNTINPKKLHNYCFRYVVPVALNHENIGKHPKRISKIRPLIDKYDREEVIFCQKQMTGKILKQTTCELVLLFCLTPNNKEEIKRVYVSKHSSEPPKKLMLLMITGREKWHYLAEKSLSKLLRGIT